MPIDVNKDILWLQVTIEHVLIMDVLKAQEYLCEIKLSFCLGEQTLVLEQIEEFTARTEVHHEMQVILGVESPE